jgi:hypothetical protein
MCWMRGSEQILLPYAFNFLNVDKLRDRTKKNLDRIERIQGYEFNLEICLRGYTHSGTAKEMK